MNSQPLITWFYESNTKSGTGNHRLFGLFLISVMYIWYDNNPNPQPQGHLPIQRSLSVIVTRMTGTEVQLTQIQYKSCVLEPFPCSKNVLGSVQEEPSHCPWHTAAQSTTKLHIKVESYLVKVKEVKARSARRGFAVTFT